MATDVRLVAFSEVPFGYADDLTSVSPPTFRLKPMISGRLELCKFINKLFHSDNDIISYFIKAKSISPSSMLGDNYRYLCAKYD